MTNKDEATFWVIERFESGKSAGYWDGGHSRQFISDIEDACQFRREQDPKWIMRSWHWDDCKITEHAMIPIAPPPPAPLAEDRVIELAIQAEYRLVDGWTDHKIKKEELLRFAALIASELRAASLAGAGGKVPYLGRCTLRRTPSPAARGAEMSAPESFEQMVQRFGYEAGFTDYEMDDVGLVTGKLDNRFVKLCRAISQWTADRDASIAANYFHSNPFPTTMGAIAQAIRDEAAKL